MKNYYDILGTNPDVSSDEIKKCYRKLAMKFHPDRNNSSDSEKRFKEINEAYDVLGDSQKRSSYDASRNQSNNGFDQFSGFHSAGFPDDWSDLFSDFGDIFGRAQHRHVNKQTTENPVVRFNISLNDLESGEIIQTFESEESFMCSTCSGSGGFDPTICTSCNGKGEVRTMHQAGSIRIQSVTTCGRCQGHGKKYNKICTACSGKGLKKEKKKYRVKINTEIV